MKHQTFIVIAFTLVTAIAFTSCKKDNAKTDNSSLFKNTIWVGEYKNASGTIQPVSIEFIEGGAVGWYELAGEASGSWKTDNNTLTVTFSTVSFTAEISGGNQLINFKGTGGADFSMVSASLNPNADESLDATTWTAPNLILKFKAGNKVDMYLGAAGNFPTYPNVDYTRKAKTVRFTAGGIYKWFVVANSKTTYKGANSFDGDPTVYPFSMTKN